MTTFKRAALQMSDPERQCIGDGYRLLLLDLEQQIKGSLDGTLSIQDYLKEEKYGCVGTLFEDREMAREAKKFLKALAAHDGDKKLLSPFDLHYGIYDLYGEQWQEDWQSVLLDGAEDYLDESPAYSALERVRILGAPLLDSTAPKELSTKSLLLLKSLATYLGTLPATDPRAALTTSLDFYWNQKDLPEFKGTFGMTYQEFLTADPTQRRDLFGKAVAAKFPDEAALRPVIPFLTRKESVQYSLECFRQDPIAAMTLFEKVPLSPWGSMDYPWEVTSKESEFFPNLPQDYPYADRQKIIDEFLGEPVATLKTNFWQNAIQGARPTLKKYLWVGDTEVFSIEAEQPGPTTLVFAPHFHEDNPRKMFHWIKDLPLQSGRVILIPEANRGMHRLKRDTNPMNGLFNEALGHDRIDYLVVRRVEYLMGLVDGMVGVHDAYAGPFYISDVVTKAKSKDKSDPAPAPSPWVPKEVLEIQDIPQGEDSSSDKKVEAQPQWQIAAFSRRLLETLYGEKFRFTPEQLGGQNSPSAGTATGYMNFHLGKPAMTFEGKKGAEHGQLHAMALYSLLLGFGHQIDPSFEDVLGQTQPEMDTSIYEGLPVTGEPTKRPIEEPDPTTEPQPESDSNPAPENPPEP